MNVGMAGHRFVHGIVDDFREQMVQRLLVGAADIHAGAAAHRLQPLQHLDVVGGVGVGTGARRGSLRRRRGTASGRRRGRGGEQVAGRGGRFLCGLGHGRLWAIGAANFSSRNGKCARKQ